MIKKTKSAPGKETGAAQETSNTSNDNGNTSAAQRARLLARLRQVPVSTLDARHALDILHPGGRVMELRRLGFNILTYWRSEESLRGKVHRVALYVLTGESEAYHG
jgi:Helix-turn-helix domain